MVQNWRRRRSGIYTNMHLLASELGLPICCLLLAMRVQCQDVTLSLLFHIGKDSNIPNNKKENRQLDKYDRLR